MDGECEQVFNPACTRLRDGSLHLYPRMVASGNVSRIGSFQTHERQDGTLLVEPCGYALKPKALYELGDRTGGHGCEDPRVTYIEELGVYVMAYVAFGPSGPGVAVAVSPDGLSWERLGLVRFNESDAPVADKDAAFFPEPVKSPRGVPSLAFYHRPTFYASVASGQRGLDALEKLPPDQHEQIAIAYALRAVTRRAWCRHLPSGCGRLPARASGAEKGVRQDRRSDSPGVESTSAAPACLTKGALLVTLARLQPRPPVACRRTVKALSR